MRFSTFEVGSRFGTVKRLGAQTAAGQVLDLNLAYALTLAERQQHPRAYELANALVPPDMLEFLINGQFGPDAVNEALACLGPRVDDPGLTGPGGERLVYDLEEVRLLAPLPRANSIRVFEEHLKNSIPRTEYTRAFYLGPIDS